MDEDKEKIGLGGKIFLWAMGIIIGGSFIVTLIAELFGKNGALLAIVIIFVVLIFGFYISKNS
jgi:hypothetical protein